METKWKVVIVTLVAGAIGFVAQSNGPVGQMIWPAHEFETAPEGGILAGFIAYGVIEAIVFGLGVSFLMFGRSLVTEATPNARGVAMAAYVSIGWLLVNWVPHTALHMSNDPTAWGRLLFIEYAFHVTLILAGLMLARFFMEVLRPTPRVKATTAARAGAVTMVAPKK